MKQRPLKYVNNQTLKDEKFFEANEKNRKLEKAEGEE